MAVLFLDVDNFKQINDSMGHASGDRLLTALADRFREMLRPWTRSPGSAATSSRSCSRRSTSEREAVLIAERISRSASLPLALGDGRDRGAVSIGIAMVTDPSVAPEHVIRDADAAMYRAKELGGARFELFDETSRRRATQRLELEEALRQRDRALGAARPLPAAGVAQRWDRLVGFEALVRWEHPSGV